jgi:hypothetical protein
VPEILPIVHEARQVEAVAGSKVLNLVVGPRLFAFVGWKGNPMAEVEKVHGK